MRSLLKKKCTPIFFIFSQYRSGSALLCSLFNSHPDISCIHEGLKRGEDGVQLADSAFFLVPGEVDWWERANLIASRYPLAKHIGLHGHVDMLNDDILNAPFPKIMLYREDEILGGVKQTMMEYDRIDRGYDLDLDIAERNIALRIQRNSIIKPYATMTLSYERMTRGKNISRLSCWLNRRLLYHVGACNFTMNTRVEKTRKSLPRNMGEIYEANSYARKS